MWAVKAGDKPVAWRGQRGQGSCRNGPGRTVVTDSKRKVEEGGGCEQKRGDGHREGAAWSLSEVLAIEHQDKSWGKNTHGRGGLRAAMRCHRVLREGRAVPGRVLGVCMAQQH